MRSSFFVAVWMLIAACATPKPLLVGQTMDEVALPRASGGTLAIEDLRGQVVLVDVWASWCRPCVVSMPFYAELQAELGGRGFRFVGINIDEDRRAPSAFLETRDLELDTLLDPGAKFIGPRFKLSRMPTAFLLDREGRIRHVHLGFAQADKTWWRERIGALLDEGMP